MTTRADTANNVWIDYDEESGCWGIFDLNTGYCYGLYINEEDAHEALEKRS